MTISYWRDYYFVSGEEEISDGKLRPSFLTRGREPDDQMSECRRSLRWVEPCFYPWFSPTYGGCIKMLKRTPVVQPS